MNFFNDYIMFKLLFDDPMKKTAGSRVPRPPSVTVAPPSRRSSIFGTENRRTSGNLDLTKTAWRSSCIDVSHLSSHHLPIKQRLQRKRSGSWSAGTNSTISSASMMTIAEADECSSRKPSICAKVPSNLFCDSTAAKFSSEPRLSVDHGHRGSIPKVVVSATVRKKLSFPAQMEVPKEKEKLTRKRSSCPNAMELIAETSASLETAPVEKDQTRTPKLSLELSPSMEKAEYSLLASYLRIYQSAALKDNDSSPSEDERDHVVLHLGYNYPEELLWNRGCRSPPPASYKRQQSHKEPPVGDLISFTPSSDESVPEEVETEEAYRKTSHQSMNLEVYRKTRQSSNELNPHRVSDPVSVQLYHKNLKKKHLEAEHCNSDPVILKSMSTEVVPSSKRSMSTCHPLTKSYHHLKTGYEDGRKHSSSVHRPKTSSGSWRPPPSRSSDTRRSYKRSPSAPSPRGGSIIRRKFQTPLDSPDLAKMTLGARPSGSEPPEGQDPNNQLLVKEKTPLARTRSTLLGRIKAAAEETGPAEILLTLSYSTSIGFITVTVNKAKNLKPALNSYVKVLLFEGHRLLELKQTSVVTNNSNPEYKQAYMFGMGKSNIANINIVVEVWQNTVDKQERNVGHICLGVGAGGAGTVQFIRMVKNAGFPSVMWHKLVTTDQDECDSE